MYSDPSGYDRRYDFMGATLRLNSPGGRRVLDNMFREGYLDISRISNQDILNTILEEGFEKGRIKITKELKDEIQFFSFAEGNYHPLAEGNMSHIRNAVDAWNEDYYQYGPRSSEVREFMRDSDNYYIETEHANKSEGATLGNYRDPENSEEQGVTTKTCKK